MLAAPTFPTPVRALPELCTEHAEVWLKNDGLSHALYGGNKVRKAERLVAEAVQRGARRVLSIGAVGSHHLLTLTLFARAAGLASAAVVFPQPRTAHALDTLRAGINQGLEVHAVQHPAAIPWQLLRVLRRGDYFVPPGGSNAIGARACAEAVAELRAPIAAGELPVPDLIVVPLGSGGTCAGLATGVVEQGLPTRVLGVQVVGGVGPRWAARYLANGPEARARLELDARYVGPGYGFATPEGNEATAVAHRLGLELDPTYTAKAFAALCELARRGMPQIKTDPRASCIGTRWRPLRWIPSSSERRASRSCRRKSGSSCASYSDLRKATSASRSPLDNATTLSRTAWASPPCQSTASISFAARPSCR